MKSVTSKKRQFITKKSMLGIEKRRSDVTKTRINYKPNILDCLCFCDSELVREVFDYAKKGLLEMPYHWKNKERFNGEILFFLSDDFKKNMIELSRRNSYHVLNALKNSIISLMNISEKEHSQLDNASNSNDEMRVIHGTTLNFQNMVLDLKYVYDPDSQVWYLVSKWVIN